MNESGQVAEKESVKLPPFPALVKGHKRTEAEAALRGVDRVVFGNGDDWQTWYRSFAEPERWYEGGKGFTWTSSEDLYRRVQSEACSLHYMHAGIPYGSLENASYDAVCNLVSRLLRKQISYKEFRAQFWRAVEGQGRKPENIT